jgi:hypothetical protein
MNDPVCDPSRIHYFRQPVYDGETCLCGQTTYRAETSYHRHDEEEPKPFNPLTDVITSPWAPLIESALLSGDSTPSVSMPDFGGGQSGGAGASGDW